MIVFKRKEKAPARKTIQDIQTAFNQVVFEVGDLTYRKHMIKEELSRLESALNERKQKLDTMGKQAQLLRAKAQEELKQTVKAGEANAQETPKAS
jgi:hypothetical protein